MRERGVHRVLLISPQFNSPVPRVQDQDQRPAQHGVNRTDSRTRSRMDPFILCTRIDMTAARLTNRGRTGTGHDGGHGTQAVSCFGRLGAPCFDVVLIHGTMPWVSDQKAWKSAVGNQEYRDLGFRDTLLLI